MPRCLSCSMKILIWLAVVAFCCTWRTGAVHACLCETVGPADGFDRAQYVFTGRVVSADHHEWLIEVDRVWKGQERLGHIIKLKDAYAATNCEFFFRQGERYIFFAIVAKGGRDIFFHPQVCNWTSHLRSTRVPSQTRESLWIEDFVVQEHGPGESPRDQR